jgi:short-subunit dehydrogenase
MLNPRPGGIDVNFAQGDALQARGSAGQARRETGRNVNVGSNLGRPFGPNLAVYTATKFGLLDDPEQLVVGDLTLHTIGQQGF